MSWNGLSAGKGIPMSVKIRASLYLLVCIVLMPALAGAREATILDAPEVFAIVRNAREALR